jgi:uncharacterized protein YbaP (TraB family)
MARLFFSLMLLLSFHAAAEQPLAYQQQALLWRITTPQQQLPSYLFGTIHSEDARVLDLPPAIVQALDDSRYFVMELVPDAAVGEQLSRSMMFPAGQSLSTLLERQLYEQTRQAVVQHGLPADAAGRMKPWALVMVLNMPKPRTGLYLDQMLHDIAAHQGKEVGGIETVDEQIETLDGMSMAMQIVLLRHTLEHYQEIPAFTEQLIDAWLRRDLEELQRLGDESNEGLPGDVEQLLQTRLVDRRNARMAERMVPLVKKGGAFVAAGALHLPGQQGLIALLRRHGFKVEPVY